MQKGLPALCDPNGNFPHASLYSISAEVAKRFGLKDLDRSTEPPTMRIKLTFDLLILVCALWKTVKLVICGCPDWGLVERCP
eukprot:4537967-Prymnesium_polylepis.1